jgi:FixJ family two-component response regulator
VPVIAIIDDDASVRAAADNFLSSLGYSVHTFASAEDFLKSSHLADSSCVIADVQMPGVNGLDLLKTIRSRGNDIPFIFITAFPSENMRTRAAKAGANGLLEKPFACCALTDFITAAINRDRRRTR